MGGDLLRAPLQLQLAPHDRGQVAVVGDKVEISIGTHLIRTHSAHHDRTREHGALANPGGRPHRANAA